MRGPSDATTQWVRSRRSNARLPRYHRETGAGDRLVRAHRGLEGAFEEEVAGGRVVAVRDARGPGPSRSRRANGALRARVRGPAR